MQTSSPFFCIWPYPPFLTPLPAFICTVHPSALPSLTPFIPIHKSLYTYPHSHPHFPSLVSSFLPVPTPHFLPYPFLSPSIHPSHLNYAVATQLQCHCPRFNVNVVSLSQLLGHYHPSQLIIVIQIHGQTKHLTENKGAQVENKGAHGKEKHVAVYAARVKFNLVLWRGKNRHFIFVNDIDAICKMYRRC